MTPTLYLIIPCYNEEPLLAQTHATLCAKLQSMIAQHTIAPTSALVFVDDGSTDRSWEVLSALTSDCPPEYIAR